MVIIMLKLVHLVSGLIGKDPLDVQERLGHSRLAITWQYAHNTDVIRQQTHQILSTIYK